jgi:hypothetical protein
MNITIVRDGVTLGEWAEDEVRLFLSQGRIVATDFYWKPGMSTWFPVKVLMTQLPPPPPRSSGLPPIPSVPRTEVKPTDPEQDCPKNSIRIEARSAKDACHQMIDHLSTYTRGGYKGGRAEALVNGFLNRYWLTNPDGTFLVEFDLKPSLPYIQNGFVFTLASLVLWEPNAKKTIKRMGIL